MVLALGAMWVWPCDCQKPPAGGSMPQAIIGEAAVQRGSKVDPPEEGHSPDQLGRSTASGSGSIGAGSSLGEVEDAWEAFQGQRPPDWVSG